MFTEKDYFEDTFSNLKLSSTKVHGVEFDSVVFDECDFSGTTFSSCRFIDCIFRKCLLTIAKPVGSSFSSVEFTDSKVTGVDWSLAYWPDFAAPPYLKFSSCDVSDSSFFGLTLEEMYLQDCKACDVDFREGSFQNGHFTGTEFTGSLFHHTNLTSTDFTDSINVQISVVNNVVKGARFSSVEALGLLKSLGVIIAD